jgi:hypothetical protein
MARRTVRPELGQGLLAGAAHRAFLNLRGGLVAERGHRLGQGLRVPVADLSAVQQRQRGRQLLGEGLRDVQAALRGDPGQPQRARDVLTHPAPAGAVHRVGRGDRIGGHPGQHLLLARGQPGRVPLQGHQQIDPPGVVQRGRVEQRQGRDQVRPGPGRGQFRGNRPGLLDRVQRTRRRRDRIEHTYDSTAG